MSDDIAELAKAVKQLEDLVEKIYDDGLSEPVQEAGGLLGDVIRLMRHFPQRALAFLEEAKNKVPEDRQQPPRPEIAGPTLESIRFLPAASPLYEMFNNLLSRAMDKERMGEAHPAFPHILQQLAPDEALFFFRAAREGVPVERDFEIEDGVQTGGYTDEIAIDGLANPEFADMYLQHLSLLGLVKWADNDQQVETEGVTIVSNKVRARIVLTPLGELLADACLPDELPVEWGW